MTPHLSAKKKKLFLRKGTRVFFFDENNNIFISNINHQINEISNFSDNHDAYAHVPPGFAKHKDCSPYTHEDVAKTVRGDQH